MGLRAFDMTCESKKARCLMQGANACLAMSTRT
jgi:hypothetical protein